MSSWYFNFLLALTSVSQHALRSLLTALGIVFGVAAVITMTAISNGARQAILEQLKLVGTNNIEITGLDVTRDDGDTRKTKADNNAKPTKNVAEGDKKPWSRGLTLADAEIIAALPSVECVSPEIIANVSLVRGERLKKGRCVGIVNDFFTLNGLEVEEGTLFHDRHLHEAASVCIIGKGVRAQFFNTESPLGKKIKCGDAWFTVIGVLAKRFVSEQSLTNLGLRDYNQDVFVPVQSALLRIQNRATRPFYNLEQASNNDNEWNYGDGGPEPPKAINYHQLERLVVRVKDSRQLVAAADVVARLLKRRHNGVLDYEVNVPELLLKEQQKTESRMSFALIAISAISLLVGGIGIMNIMLASVLERVKEIGVRRSLGAKRIDIVLQFLFEAVVISLAGGIIGILLGLLTAALLTRFGSIQTIVPAWAVLLSFGVASTVGLVFGIVPARRAAFLDPITALRQD